MGDSMGDPTAVEVLLEEFLHRNAWTNIRILIADSQDRLRWASIHEESKNEKYAKITDLLIERQNQVFSQIKLQRTSGRGRFFWRPLCHLYLDLEQTEYMHFTDWFPRRRPIRLHMPLEFRSWVPASRVPTYLFLFAILWIILGEVLYYLSKFARVINEPIPTSVGGWMALLVLIVSDISTNACLG